MPLQEWVSLVIYFKGVVTTKIPEEDDKLAILMQSDENVTQQKKIIMDPGIPPYKEYRDPKYLCDCLQGWFEHYTSWSDQMGEEVKHINTAIFKLCRRLGTPYILDG